MKLANRISGQALIESSMMMVLLCLILFSALQIFQFFTAKEFMDHAAATTVRSQTVGFNDFMVRKVARVASIPVSGKMQIPDPGELLQERHWLYGTIGEQWDRALYGTPVSQQLDIELSRIPVFLGTEYPGQLHGVLQYQAWESDLKQPDRSYPEDGMTEITLSIDAQASMPFAATFIEDGHLTINSSARIEDHAALYLE